MNDWGIGIKAGELALSLTVAVCTALAVYVRLSTKSMLSDFLEKLKVTLDLTFVKKEVSDATKEAERHAAVIEALRVGAVEKKVDERLTALEENRRMLRQVSPS